MPAWPACSVPYKAPIEGEQRSVRPKAEVTNRKISIGGEPPALRVLPSSKSETID